MRVRQISWKVGTKLFTLTISLKEQQLEQATKSYCHVLIPFVCCLVNFKVIIEQK